MKRYYCSLCIFCFFLSGCDDNDTLMVSSDISHNDNYNEESEDNDSQKESEDNDSQKESEDNDSQKESEDNDSQGDAGCESICDEGFKCENGDCLPICTDDLTYCNGECLDLEILHLADCSSCIENFCDSDNNLINGCEIDAKAFDKENCGGCGVTCKENEKCDAGSCVLNCKESETVCGNVCVNLSEKHLSSCGQCADGYGNCDEDMSNGCETAINVSDDKNCGACGKICGMNESCVSGTCTFNTYSRLIIAENTPFQTEPNSGVSVGTYPQFEYCQVLGESNGWYKCQYNGKTGWVPGTLTAVVCDTCPGRAAVTEAEKYLYSKTQKCTYDMKDIIPYFNPSEGYNNNCANFVTSILQAVNLINYHTMQVVMLQSYCSANNENYHEVPFESAQAGDIWLRYHPASAPTYSHTELVVGTYYNVSDNLTHVITIGSTNFASCAPDAIRDGAYQRVIYTDRNLQAQPGAQIFSRQH